MVSDEVGVSGMGIGGVDVGGMVFAGGGGCLCSILVLLPNLELLTRRLMCVSVASIISRMAS